jgi:uncharacterized membrane protein YdbT with pleckstrin-like domain
MASGERVVRRAHQHWFMLLWNSRVAVLSLILALVLLIVRIASAGTGLFFDVLGWVTLVLFLFGLASIGWSWLRYRNEEYMITSRRIIHVEGVVNKKATDSSLEKINDAVLSESIFGRVFGFGDLDVLTASESGIERLRMLRDAKSFKKAMLDAKHELEIDLVRPTMPPLRSQEAQAQASAQAPIAGPQPDESMTADEVSAAIERLTDMRDRGLITPAEFEAKRQEMLARL